MNTDGAEIPAILIAGGLPMNVGNTIDRIADAIAGLSARKAGTGATPCDTAQHSASAAQHSASTAREKPGALKTVYIGAANGDSLPFYMMMKPLLGKAGAGEIEFIRLARDNADVGGARAALECADIVFLSGGEVEDGINWINRHGLADLLRDLYKGGRLFIGVSAGTIMLGSHWVKWGVEGDDSTSELFECLGIVPQIFDTHAENEDWIELKAALKLMGRGSRGFGIPRGGIVAANGAGGLVNIEKKYLTFVYNGDGFDIT